MAARRTSALFRGAVIFYLLLQIDSNNCERFGERAAKLHLAKDEASVRHRRTQLFTKPDDSPLEEPSHRRVTREITQTTDTAGNVTTVVSLTFYLL